MSEQTTPQIEPGTQQILDSLDGIRHGMERLNVTMRAQHGSAQAAADRAIVGYQFDGITMDPADHQERYANASRFSPDSNPPQLSEAQRQAAERHENHQTWLAQYEDYASQITGIAQETQDETVRDGAFRTAAHLAATSYWRESPDHEIEGTEVTAAQLAGAQDGDPVLVMRVGHDGTRRFSGGTLDGRLGLAPDDKHALQLRPSNESGILVTGQLLEHHTFRPTGMARERYLKAAGLASSALTTTGTPIRGVDILQSDASDGRIITGVESVGAMVDVILSDPNLDVYTAADLVRSLDYTGMSLTELGFTSESLDVAEAGFSAELERLGNPDRPDGPPETLANVEKIGTALQTIRDHR